MNTGATRSVCGLFQAHVTCDGERKPFQSSSSEAIFLLGDTIYVSLGILKNGIPNKRQGFIDFEVNVVSADIPLLLELYELRR